MAFGRLRSNSSRTRAEINMVPLIDVMLVLLVIFILTAPLVTQSVQLKLPETVDLKEQTASNDEPVPPILIAINELSEIHINDDKMDSEELAIAKLTDLKNEATLANVEQMPIVQLHVDKKVSYEIVAKMITALSKVGLANIGFVSEKEE